MAVPEEVEDLGVEERRTADSKTTNNKNDKENTYKKTREKHGRQ